MNDPHRSARRLFFVLALAASVTLSAGGCVGYLMGWSDVEVDRIQRIAAELEAKNAALIDENIELRAKVDSFEKRLDLIQQKGSEPLRSDRVGGTPESGDTQCQN